MKSTARRWLVVSACLVVSLGIGYLTFVLAWNPTPRFTFALLPGAYIAAGLNKLFKLPWNGAGVWLLFFSSHVAFWFSLLLVGAWAVSRARDRWRARKTAV